MSSDLPSRPPKQSDGPSGRETPRRLVLVTWSSKHGGTAGIGEVVGDALRLSGFDVATVAVGDVRSLDGVDAVILGGAIYANRWPRAAVRFVNRHLVQLRHLPIWFFSSGPLDASADAHDLPATSQVAVLAERVGAKSHVTFGGRLAPDVKDFPARAMAKTRSGDWRNNERIRAWTAQVAAQLPTAMPGVPVDHPARSLRRTTTYALVGWGMCAGTMAVLLNAVSLRIALAIHGVLAPVLFAVLAWRYFRVRGARDPLETAIIWTMSLALGDLVVVAGIIQGSARMFADILGTWLPVMLIFVVTWAVGSIMAMVPAARAPV